MQKSLAIAIDGHENLFRVEKHASLFFHHETVVTMKEKLAAVTKEVKKMSKGYYQVMVTLSSMDEHCKQINEIRYVLYNGSSDSEIEVRKFNGWDFSEKKSYSFTSERELFKYFQAQLLEKSSRIMEGIPEDGNSWYSQKLENMEIPDFALAFCS